MIHQYYRVLEGLQTKEEYLRLNTDLFQSRRNVDGRRDENLGQGSAKTFRPDADPPDVTEIRNDFRQHQQDRPVPVLAETLVRSGFVRNDESVDLVGNESGFADHEVGVCKVVKNFY